MLQYRLYEENEDHEDEVDDEEEEEEEDDVPSQDAPSMEWLQDMSNKM